jgi:phytoene dehydrogenase-like protein
MPDQDNSSEVYNGYTFDVDSGIFTLPIAKELHFASGNYKQIYIKQPTLNTTLGYKKILDSHMRFKKNDGSITYNNEYIESQAYRDGDDEWFLQQLVNHIYSVSDHQKPIATLSELLNNEHSDAIQEILECFKLFFFRLSQSIRTHVEQQNSIANLMPMVAGMIAKEKLYDTDKRPLE